MTDKNTHLRLCGPCIKLLDDARLSETKKYGLEQVWQGIGQLHDCADDLYASVMACCLICTEVLRGCVAKRLQPASRFTRGTYDEEISLEEFEDALNKARLAYDTIPGSESAGAPLPRVLSRINGNKTPTEILKAMCGSFGFDIRALDVSYSMRRHLWHLQLFIPLRTTESHHFPYATFAAEEWTVNDDLRLAVAEETSTAGPATIALARSWLNACIDGHYHAWSDWAPRRLLHLSEGIAKLVDGVSEQYVTLSHCWGTEPFTTLTSKNIQTFRNGMSIDVFLPSFRDAMHIVQSLGFAYLWIDCFCILQDDPTELAEECGLMNLVYSHAVVNIGALNALSPHDGIFRSRPLRRRFARYRDMRLTNERFNEPDGPLFNRGWVFQERYLSQRMLHFGDQLWWSCSCGLGDEADDLSDLRFGRADKGFHMGQGQRLEDRSSEFNHWATVLKLYTRARLTYPDTDKVRALQGVLNRVEERIGEKAQFGQFLDAKSLLWSIEDSSASRSTRGPTWSWSSMDGPLSFLACHHLAPSMARDSEYKEDLLMVILPTVIDAQLFCIGRLLEANILSPNEILLPNGINSLVKFDSVTPATVVVMPVVMEAHSPGWMSMLLLVPHADGTFSRVGMASFFSFDAVRDRLWFDRPGTGRTHTVDFRSAYLAAKPRLIVIR